MRSKRSRTKRRESPAETAAACAGDLPGLGGQCRCLGLELQQGDEVGHGHLSGRAGAAPWRVVPGTSESGGHSRPAPVLRRAHPIHGAHLAPPRDHRRIPLARRLGYAAVVGAVVLLVLEVVARQVEARLPAPAALPSPSGGRWSLEHEGRGQADAGHEPVYLVWSDATGTWVAAPPGPHAYGDAPELRGAAPTSPKDPAEWRILTVGDSSVWGDGVARLGVRSCQLSVSVARNAGWPVPETDNK